HRARLWSTSQCGEDGRGAAHVVHVPPVYRRPDAFGRNGSKTHVESRNGGDTPCRAPAVAVEHRQSPEISCGAVVSDVASHSESVQIGASMRIHDALGSSGGPGRVVEADERVLVFDL